MTKESFFIGACVAVLSVGWIFGWTLVSASSPGLNDTSAASPAIAENCFFKEITEGEILRMRVPPSNLTLVFYKKNGGSTIEVTSVTPNCEEILHKGQEKRRVTVERSKQGECYVLLHGFRKTDEGMYEFREGSLFGTAIPNSCIHVELIERHARSGAGLSKSNPVWTIFCSLLALALVSLLCL